MEQAKLGALLVAFSLVFGLFLISFHNSLSSNFDAQECIASEECVSMDQSLGLTHFGFGFFGFMLGLGVYFLVFNRSQEKILKRIEAERKSLSEEEKFKLMLRMVNEYEAKVLSAIHDQDGITQNTLRLRTDMSKAKLSYVLQELEKRGLVVRTQKGKSLEVHLRI